MTDPNAKHDARAVLQEYIKRFGDVPDDQAEEADARRTYKWREQLFSYQLDLIDDPALYKTALCSRRAGKTYCACYYLIEVATRKPGSICAYIALTRGSAKRLMWAEMKRAARKYMLNVKFNNSELIATLQNGSQIILTGANDEADVDKLRGSAYALVILDEAASFGPHIDSLVEEVLEPALVDQRGSLVMIGTPSASFGLFHRATTDPSYGYSTHAWTILDNPHIPHAEEWLEKRRKQRGWSDHNPIYLREWCGKWVRSDSCMVYRYTQRNIVQSVPTHEYDFEYVLGVDLGYEDSTGFVIGAFSRDLPDFYVVECYKENHLIPSQIAERIKEYHATYDFTVMVADTGGLGKSIVEEFKARHLLPLRAAEKRHKLSYQELLNGDLADGKVKVLEGSALLEEWDHLEWDERGKENARYDNHLADAMLYAWRESRHYTHQPTTAEPLPGTPAHTRRIEQGIIDTLERKLDNNDGEAWWESSYQLN